MEEVFSKIVQSADLYSCVISFFIFFHLIFINKHKTKTDILFSIPCILTFFLSLFDFFGKTYSGSVTLFAIVSHRICIFGYYLVGILIYNTYIIFLKHYFKLQAKYFNVISLSCFIGYFIGLIFTQFYPFYYGFDAFNVYYRSTFYFVNLIFQYTLILMIIIITFSKNNNISIFQRLIFLAIIILPVLTQLLQHINVNLQFTNLGVTISFFIVYIKFNNEIEDEMNEKYLDLEKSEKELIDIQNNTIMALSNLVENRDSDTGNHVKRTCIYVKLLANKAKEEGLYQDELTSDYISLLTEAASLHDIGKIVVPDSILQKPGKLTDEEFDIMKKHTTEGKRIVHEVLSSSVNKDYFNITVEIATHHHEKWNGFGYPDKLSEQNIPLSARIMAIADVFDALVSPRCYKPAFSVDKAFSILTQDAGSHFDPSLVPLFIKLRPEVEKIMEEYGVDL